MAASQSRLQKNMVPATRNAGEKRRELEMNVSINIKATLKPVGAFSDALCELCAVSRSFSQLLSYAVDNYGLPKCNKNISFERLRQVLKKICDDSFDSESPGIADIENGYEYTTASGINTYTFIHTADGFVIIWQTVSSNFSSLQSLHDGMHELKWKIEFKEGWKEEIDSFVRDSATTQTVDIINAFPDAGFNVCYADGDFRLWNGFMCSDDVDGGIDGALSIRDIPSHRPLSNIDLGDAMKRTLESYLR
jgi:hypothetical protein